MLQMFLFNVCKRKHKLKIKVSNGTTFKHELTVTEFRKSTSGKSRTTVFIHPTDCMKSCFLFFRFAVHATTGKWYRKPHQLSDLLVPMRRNDYSLLRITNVFAGSRAHKTCSGCKLRCYKLPKHHFPSIYNCRVYYL